MKTHETHMKNQVMLFHQQKLFLIHIILKKMAADSENQWSLTTKQIVTTKIKESWIILIETQTLFT